MYRGGIGALKAHISIKVAYRQPPRQQDFAMEKEKKKLHRHTVPPPSIWFPLPLFFGSSFFREAPGVVQVLGTLPPPSSHFPVQGAQRD